MPLVIALAFALVLGNAAAVTPVQVVDSPRAEALEKLFQRLGYGWPLRPGQSIPPVEVKHLPRDLAEIREIDRRKALFVRIVLPLAMMENERLREQRRLAALFLQYPRERLGAPYRAWLERLMERYGVDRRNWDWQRRSKELLLRLDEVPEALVVAQAAMESGWGTSRFALEGNALFGQWTWKGQGLRPSAAHPDATHKVRAFPDLRASVRAYLHNLNTGFAYREFRALRARLREAGRPLEADRLALGLKRYSQRGLDYVRELQRMLERPELAVIEALNLALPGPVAPTPG